MAEVVDAVGVVDEVDKESLGVAWFGRYVVWLEEPGEGE